VSPISKKKFYPLLWFLLVIILIGGYGFFQARSFIQGPTIILETPQTGELITDPFITIRGQVLRISKIHLNDRQIFTDDDGLFNESLLLLPGYNILTLKAEDGFGRETVKILELILEETSA